VAGREGIRSQKSRRDGLKLLAITTSHNPAQGIKVSDDNLFYLWECLPETPFTSEVGKRVRENGAFGDQSGNLVSPISSHQQDQ
jgi:hypothetical protein